MWIEKFEIENVKAILSQHIRLGTSNAPYPWVTLLGENGTGKSTILQALGLLLAGPDAAGKLLVPEGWLRDEGKEGRIGMKFHQDANDPGSYEGEKKKRGAFQYSLNITGRKELRIGKRVYNEPLVVPSPGPITTWIRTSAFLPQGNGWFAAGYGAFRRLTRQNRILVPSLQAPTRINNFAAQFEEDKALEAFETWMVYLDYKISKSNDDLARRQMDWGRKAINDLLPPGNTFSRVDDHGRIWFSTPEGEVSTVGLSDGFRSILALAGDLIWRMIEAFPGSAQPLLESGVVLIDELDIHLHPSWQREIPRLLRRTFPGIQFIVATHSPIVAAGAGHDAVTYRFSKKDGSVSVDRIEGLFAKSVDEVLKSPAFGLVSEYSAQTEEQIQRHYQLKQKRSRTKEEQDEFQLTFPFVQQALGAEPSPLLEEARALIEKLQRK